MWYNDIYWTAFRRWKTELIRSLYHGFTGRSINLFRCRSCLHRFPPLPRDCEFLVPSKMHHIQSESIFTSSTDSFHPSALCFKHRVISDTALWVFRANPEARVLTEMETLSVILDKEGSLQYGSRASGFSGNMEFRNMAVPRVVWDMREGVDKERQREMLRGSCFVSVPSSEMELTSADFVTLRSLPDCYKIFSAPGAQKWKRQSSSYHSKKVWKEIFY